MNNLQLSKRLQTIASFIRKGSFFADIGSDHAYLPTYICLHDDNAHAIASEVREGPFQLAKKTVETYDVTDRVDVRLGDGLETIRKTDKLTEIVVAGMGGKLIEHIISNGLDKVQTVKRLILQPNNDAIRLRQFFYEHRFQLKDEKIIEENGHYYEILVFDQCNATCVYDKQVNLEQQLLFGPILMKEKSKPFIKKWQKECAKLKKIVRQMELSKQNLQSEIDAFHKKIKWIEEVTR
ncbi:MAG TPA: tRNA (adenine(22)-N(1))-methyltransferase TrmK [Pseudogracilibacillus sp.]|nr:tRNA (adenine(22)-N(1))-methyltransferase TrmK [Pseudogracilibacillus sp.]